MIFCKPEMNKKLHHRFSLTHQLISLTLNYSLALTYSRKIKKWCTDYSSSGRANWRSQWYRNVFPMPSKTFQVGVIINASRRYLKSKIEICVFQVSNSGFITTYNINGTTKTFLKKLFSKTVGHIWDLEWWEAYINMRDNYGSFVEYCRARKKCFVTISFATLSFAPLSFATIS